MLKISKAYKKSILLLFSATVLIACNREQENISPRVNVPESVSGFLRNENGLRITLLTDDEDDETSYFEAFVFNFGDGGKVTARSETALVDGTYSVFMDDGMVELRMNYPDDRNFSELNDDWYFVSIEQKRIRFNDSGDKLEFQQIN